MKATAAGLPILKVTGLSTQFVISGGEKVVKAVDDASLTLDRGDSVALIGESGCGKSTLALSILRILPETARIVSGTVLFEGEDLLRKSPKEMAKIRGHRISIILQDPMTSLNPVFTVGNQMSEGLRDHLGMRGRALLQRIRELILAVKIPEPERRMRQWPHEMSGGMRQRIVGAIAVSCEPRLIIADEPTTNLDVTIQLQYLNLLKEIQDRTGVTLLFITHDLGIVAKMCRYVHVMYAGKIVERAPVMEIYDHPLHPYTKGLLDSAFGLTDVRRRSRIKGEPPDPANLPSGCSFHPRCKYAESICREKEPPETILGETISVKCWQHGNR